MAIWKFTEAMMNGKPIQVYAEGKLLRDFTYIDDIIEGINSILGKLDKEPPPQLMNIGNNHPITVNDLVTELEQAFDRKAVIEFLPMQPGDVKATFADIVAINGYCGFKPDVSIKEGLTQFTNWYFTIWKPLAFFNS